MRKKTAQVWIVSLIVLAFALIGLSSVLNRAPATNVPGSLTASSTVLGMSEAGAPWPVELAHLKDRMAADGLQLLSMEGSALHIHQHLDIFIHGQRLAVPPGIGIIPSPELFSPIHVHDETGIIHVESPKVQDFTLGEFFDVWGVRLAGSCLGGYCTDATSTLQLYVNGTLYTGDLRAFVLAQHQELVITYGTPAELPKSIPAFYTFPAGY